MAKARSADLSVLSGKAIRDRLVRQDEDRLVVSPLLVPDEQVRIDQLRSMSGWGSHLRLSHHRPMACTLMSSVKQRKSRLKLHPPLCTKSSTCPLADALLSTPINLFLLPLSSIYSLPRDMRCSSAGSIYVGTSRFNSRNCSSHSTIFLWNADLGAEKFGRRHPWCCIQGNVSHSYFFILLSSPISARVGSASIQAR